MRTKFFLGIDPGATGAAAFVDGYGKYVIIIDYPGSASELGSTMHDLITSPVDIREDIALAVIEKVNPMPKQGISSTGKFMKNAGIWEGVVAALKIPIQLITPQRWRKILDSSVPRKPTKEDLRAYAIRKWPLAAPELTRVKDHNRAEALIIAEYARMKSFGQVD
jgi:hypothetical protein